MKQANSIEPFSITISLGKKKETKSFATAENLYEWLMKRRPDLLGSNDLDYIVNKNDEKFNSKFIGR